jgi:transcriptional regulator
MHPNPAFAWSDEQAMRAFVQERAFAHIFVAAPSGSGVAHAPVLVTDGGHIRFHLARSNPVAAFIEQGTVLASITDADFYVSPDWYASDDQVPTWNYRAAELSGSVRRLDDQGLTDLLDGLSAVHEERLAPKPVWTRDKMTPGRFEAMLGAIIGYEMHVTSWRGTLKFGQHKSAADRAGVITAIEALGRHDAVQVARSVAR